MPEEDSHFEVRRGDNLLFLLINSATAMDSTITNPVTVKALMIEHGVGVRVSRAIEFKGLDEDFFAEE